MRDVALLFHYSPGTDIIKQSLIYSHFDPGPVVQSIVSLTSSLVDKMLLTILASIISKSQIFLLKNVSSFCKCTQMFSAKNISVYAIFNDQSFNDSLTNDIVSIEQLGPVFFSKNPYFGII